MIKDLGHENQALVNTLIAIIQFNALGSKAVGSISAIAGADSIGANLKKHVNAREQKNPGLFAAGAALQRGLRVDWNGKWGHAPQRLCDAGK